MGLLEGFTECWIPGPACHVDWSAWAAIGTAAGVTAAIVGPMVTGWVRRRRLTVLFAASFYDELWQDLQAVAHLRRDYRLHEGDEKADGWAVEAMLMCDSSGDRRRELAEAGVKLKLCGEARYLAQWQDIDSGMAIIVADAINAARSLRDNLAKPINHPRTVEEDWDAYFFSLRTSAAAAEWAIHRAAKECNDRVMAQTIGWRSHLASARRAISSLIGRRKR